MRAQPRLFSVLPLVGLGLLVCYLMANISCADSALLPERVARTAQERVDAGTYQTLVFGVLADGKSEVIAFGKLDKGKPPDGDTVYEIGSITKTFTARRGWRTGRARGKLAGSSFVCFLTVRLSSGRCLL